MIKKMNGTRLLLGLPSLLLAACSAEQPAGLKTVEAVEVPLAGPADRKLLLDLMARDAREAGDFHLDAATPEALANVYHATIHATVWRGHDDDFPDVSASDVAIGAVWVEFPLGDRADASARLRQRLLRDIRQQWPATKDLPVLPTGGLPLREDLVLTQHGYRIKSSVAGTYHLPPDSPLIASAG
jgi:hypothetical protein